MVSLSGYIFCTDTGWNIESLSFAVKKTTLFLLICEENFFSEPRIPRKVRLTLPWSCPHVPTFNFTLGLPIWLFWSQVLKLRLFLNAFGFFWKFKKSRQNLAFFQSESLISGKTLSKLHIHYKSVMKRVYNYAECAEYW